jgi:hypothetical protein
MNGFPWLPVRVEQTQFLGAFGPAKTAVGYTSVVRQQEHKCKVEI